MALIKQTKERILLEALRLFAKDGLEAVSVSEIAGALGLTKGALYKHYRSKREIFDSILRRMEERDAENAAAYDVPEGTAQEMPEAYAKTSIDALVDYSKAQFRYWTQDEFASSFRKLLTLHQFGSEEMAKLYQQYLVSGPLGYVSDLFAALDLPRPQETALRFYAPMFFLYSVYDGATNVEAVLAVWDAHMEKERAEIQSLLGGKTMNETDMIIRRETENDYRAVEELVRESFWNVYRPGCLEHYVLHCMRDDPAFVPELALVMEKDGQIIGQNVFMRAEIRTDDGQKLPIMTMGPICIAPALKRQGYGKILLDESLKRAAALGCGALCFEGNINFYGKSGFTYASKFGIRYHDLPEGADASFFLCRELIPGYLNGVSGVYAPPAAYFVAWERPEDFEAFDAGFPHREKLKLPGQLE